jgi:hypothetical protein
MKNESGSCKLPWPSTMLDKLWELDSSVDEKSRSFTLLAMSVSPSILAAIRVSPSLAFLARSWVLDFLASSLRVVAFSAGGDGGRRSPRSSIVVCGSAGQS